jgi:hypothetical protein
LAHPAIRCTVLAMDPRLTLEGVEALVADLRRNADSRRLVGRAAANDPEPALDAAAITVRRAAPEDATGLARLAQIDSGRAPAGPALVAEVDGELLAALPLAGGRALADPFRPTGELVRLLELRAAQLNGGGRRRRWRLRGRLLRQRRAAVARARA